MTDYAPRGSPDQNSFYTNQHLGMSHHCNGNGYNYLYNNGQVQYEPVNASYSSYSPTYLPSQHGTSSSMYMPTPTSMAHQHYQLLPPTRPTMPQQPRYSYPGYSPSTVPAQRSHQQPRLQLGHELSLNPMADIESQESCNSENMLSEPILPALDGYPDVHEFDELMKRYVADLSPKKQDKALIHAKRATNIRTVLIDKKTTTVESAQFRFWVKKMFQLLPNDPKLSDRKKKICHEGKPVAVREKLFKILTRAHKACQHGGRDKTSAQVRRVYSWVPKELISRFVKLCPTCQVRRGANRASPAASDKSMGDFSRSPETGSPASRRDSVATKRSSVSVHSPLGMSSFSSTFQQQNRWMTPLQPSESKYNATDTYSTSASNNNHNYNTSQYGTSYSNYGNGNTYSTPSGFASSNVRSTNGASWSTSPQDYQVKQESRYS